MRVPQNFHMQSMRRTHEHAIAFEHVSHAASEYVHRSLSRGQRTADSGLRTAEAAI
jgi:hypothetical protein